jgi:phospholipid/cholesterol/gamma-HCH transport system permease protein
MTALIPEVERLSVPTLPDGALAGERWQMRVQHPADATVLIQLTGSWKTADRLPGLADVRRHLETGPAIRRIVFETQGVTTWDTGLLAFVWQMREWSALEHVDAELTGLPEGIQRLVRLAATVPARTIGPGEARPSWLARVGTIALAASVGAIEMLAFIGGVLLAVLALLRGKARFRRSDLALYIQDCGARALPIVTLISFLVGVILAFVGTVQLRKFGGQIYVADLVGVAMAREMGAMMTAIIMAGRTGAAFAAEIGSMQANEEVDALTTVGLSPMQFVVLPRMIALALMMPLLTLYADVVGIVGGAFVSVTMLGLTLTQYVNETQSALSLSDFAMGLIKSLVFGVLVAFAGCLRGMQCGRSSAAVGTAVTSAVVTGIVFIIVSDAILTVVYDALGV